MVPKIIVSPAQQDFEKILKGQGLKNPHPDLLYFARGAKLGISEARKIKNHLSYKPLQAEGKTVIIEDASALTIEAQNALLKILEEPPPSSLIALGVKSESTLLPTIISRCQIITPGPSSDSKLVYHAKYFQDIEGLLGATIEERFGYIERCKDREEFFQALLEYSHRNLSTNTRFVNTLLQAEEWVHQNVNIRGILEYLMLVMPGNK